MSFSDDYNKTFPLSGNTIARLHGKIISPALKDSMKTHAQELIPDALNDHHFNKMLEHVTLDEMIRYFKDAKMEGADKLSTHSMAMALMYAGQKLGVGLEVTAALGALRGKGKRPAVNVRE